MLSTTRDRPDTGLRRLSDLRAEVDRVFDDMIRAPTRTRGGWRPAADILESEEAYRIEVEVPGFRREDVEVTVEQGVLTVEGRRAAPEDDGRAYHLRERPVGRFSRSFSLPSTVDAGSVTARIDDGVLRIRLPKEERARTRKIEVDVA